MKRNYLKQPKNVSDRLTTSKRNSYDGPFGQGDQGVQSLIITEKQWVLDALGFALFLSVQ